MRFDSILDREQDGVKYECGYMVKDNDVVPVVIIDDKVIVCENINEARSKFWKGAK